MGWLKGVSGPKEGREGCRGGSKMGSKMGSEPVTDVGWTVCALLVQGTPKVSSLRVPISGMRATNGGLDDSTEREEGG